jgi:ankyrin repeat protein
MNPTSSNTSSADPEIQRQNAERQSQSEQPPPPAQGPRMVQRNPQQQQDEVRDEAYVADSDTQPAQPKLEAGTDVRVVARSDATAVTPSTVERIVPLTRKALNKAIRSNDLETINHLLKSGSIDLNIFDEVHAVPLVVAAREGNSDSARLLLQSGAEVNVTNHRNETVLMVAAQLGHFDVVKLLIEAGADIPEVDTLGDTLLNHATRAGNMSMVEKLLSLKFDVNAANKRGQTPLVSAARAGHLGVFTLLLEKSATIDASDPDHMLMYAVDGGNGAIVQKLLSLGVDANGVNRAGTTALMRAVKNRPWDRENRYLDVIKVLLNHGAQVNLRGIKVDNATVRAIKQDDIPALELLLAYGGEPYDLQEELSPLVVDMLRHRVLLKPEVVVTALMLESLYGTSLSALPEISVDKTVHEELAQLFEGLKVCSPITMALDHQIKNAGKQIQALADTGKPLSQAQKSMLIAGLLISLDGWVASWPKEDWTPYKWKYLSAQGEAKLTALVKLQAEKLAVLGEQVEEKLAAGLETLLLQCAQYTQVKNGELVVDEVGLMAHLTRQLGLYGPLADQVAAAWFTTVNQQQPIIMASSLFQSGFDEQASESAAGQALLAAFGLVLKQIDGVAARLLLRPSTLQVEQSGLYADLMFRQLHMLAQYADQAIAASASTTQGNAE